MSLPTGVALTIIGLVTLFDLSVVLTAYFTARRELEAGDEPPITLTRPVSQAMIDGLLIHSGVHVVALTLALILIFTRY